MVGVQLNCSVLATGNGWRLGWCQFVIFFFVFVKDVFCKGPVVAELLEAGFTLKYHGALGRVQRALYERLIEESPCETVRLVDDVSNSHRQLDSVFELFVRQRFLALGCGAEEVVGVGVETEVLIRLVKAEESEPVAIAWCGMALAYNGDAFANPLWRYSQAKLTPLHKDVIGRQLFHHYAKVWLKHRRV